MKYNFNIDLPKSIPIIEMSEVLVPFTIAKLVTSATKPINLFRSLGSANGHNYLGLAIPDDEDGVVHNIGTVADVLKIQDLSTTTPKYQITVLVFCRIRIIGISQESPYQVAEVEKISSLLSDNCYAGSSNLISEFRNTVKELCNKTVPESFSTYAIEKFGSLLPLDHYIDFVICMLDLSNKERKKIVLTIDPIERMKIVLPSLLSSLNNIQKNAQQNKKVILSRASESPMRGKLQESKEEFDDLEEKINKSNIPQDSMKVISRELMRMRRMSAQSPEYSMLRSYLELVSELPWTQKAKETCDIFKARADLDEDHYGMEKVKKRVLEYLAVRQLRGDMKGPILCLIGPPGVGKTSIAKSIASTLGRPFHRISLGGVSDQHDIRGHRRTYIGSMPGRIIQGLRTVKVKNPVVLLDEVDKLSRGYQGDPAAALLEVLDAEQNFEFMDTYLNIPFDLSQVLFIATANDYETIPSPLLDRLEIINVPGYTQEEKIQIARLHLVSKEVEENGLTGKDVLFSEEVLSTIIEEYTREAGVRSLQRKIGAVCRSVAVRFAEEMQTEIREEEVQADTDDSYSSAVVEYEDEDKGEEPIEVHAQMIRDVLGPPIFQSGLEGRVGVPGVAVGLAWTPSGGTVLVVEASIIKGESGLILTGQLGKVMQESAKIALSWVRQHAEEFGLEKDFMTCGEIHLHFPAGAIAKDGPSAGVTMITVLVSLLTRKCVRSDLAMTGETTLNGVVLPVGGIKEKVLAAHRSGLTRVVMPAANKKDLVDVPTSVLDNMEIILVNKVGEVLLAAFNDPPFSKPVKDDIIPSKL